MTKDKIKITNKIFQSYLICKYKAYLYLCGKSGTVSDFENLCYSSSKEYKKSQIKRLYGTYSYQEILSSPLKPIGANFNKYKIIVNLDLAINDFQININAIEITKIKDRYNFTSLLFIPNEKAIMNDKLLLAFQGFLFAEKYGKRVRHGKIIFGDNNTIQKISITTLIPKVKIIIEEIKKLYNEAPQLFLNKHCQICEFQSRCEKTAKEKDDLSLLKGMSDKEIVKQNKKGIFTVTQLSYTFRPRRRSKKFKNKYQKHHFELQALAIRENKIYILEKPDLPDCKVKIFLDIEGNPERGLYYLIGLIVVDDTSQKEYSFWANNDTDEQKIIYDFLNIIKQYNDYVIFHYGSYERKFLNMIKKKDEFKDNKLIDQILEKTYNLLSVIYNNIYFPVYYNGLKDVANYLGFKWSESDASGIQSLVWRKRWEESRNDQWKTKLLQYNLEDCVALKKTTEYAYKITSNDKLDDENKIEVVNTENLKRESMYKWQRNNFVFSDLDYINNCAYFDYQREKVFIRTNKNLRKVSIKQKKKKKQLNRVNQVVNIRDPKKCSNCVSKQLAINSSVSKIIYDLKVFKDGGVKKWIIEYKANKCTCLKCGYSVYPRRFSITKCYGHNLISWVIYQNIVMGESCGKIKKKLEDIYGIYTYKSSVLACKNYAYRYYLKTFKKIVKDIIQGNMICADETSAKLKKCSGYVWIFTTMEKVFYLLKPNREADFLKEMLENFDGVLISDFYSGYDSIDCKQQKCLVHLIRDLNDDLLRNPFDEEYKDMAEKFTILLRQIINTIDKYGLKRRNLSKHKKDVDRFFKNILNKKYNSDLAQKYQKRFAKNRDKLFTFLDYDNIPWNNNNAERGIKGFAPYRRNAKGLFTKNGLSIHLVLLSIYMTCEYQGINFWKFLISKERDIDKFVVK